MIEVIRNRKLLPVPWVKAESRISPHLQVSVRYGRNQISGERYHKSVFYAEALSADHTHAPRDAAKSAGTTRPDRYRCRRATCSG